MKEAYFLVPAVALGLSAMTAAPAAAEETGADYSAMLAEINNSGASGQAWVSVTGNQATVTVEASGLAGVVPGWEAGLPHLQHIHIGGQGVCPTMAADKDGNGWVDTVEGQPSYGMIGTTLSSSGSTGADAGINVETAPAGSTYTYERTFDVNQETQDALANGSGVVVVHDLDWRNQPTGEGAAASSKLGNPALTLTETSPALCGPMQMMPAGGADTGVGIDAAGHQSGAGDGTIIGMSTLGGGLLAVAAAAYAVRRRHS